GSSPDRDKRRDLKPGFAMSALGRLLPEIDRTVAEDLASHAGTPLELHRFIMRTLTRANSRTTVQVALSEAEITDLIDFEEDFIAHTVDEPHARRAYYEGAEFAALRERVLGQCLAIAEARLRGERRPDSLQDVVDERRKRGLEVSAEALSREIYLLLMAGTGNTAKTLNSGLQHLRQRPDWLARLQAELDAYAPEALAGGMSGFPLLKATLFEMERVFPAAPVLPRVVAKPIEFAGVRLEPGTKVLHLHTLTHFLEEIYPEPYRFRPERWLEQAPPRKAHGTFGGGTHLCLGINLARLHMPVFLGNLLRDYVLDYAEQANIRVVLHFGVPQKADLHLTLLPRATDHALSS
ncbi:MAG: cytochrome P450, partial [Opitutales bacterium]